MKRLLVWVTFLVAAWWCLAPSAGAEVLGYPFCDSLRDVESRSACLDYVNAFSSIGKWTSAVRWAKYYRGSYQCANVTALCLLTDMYAERYGSTCIPAHRNSPCEMDSGGSGTCWQGMCVDAAESAVNMLLAQDGLFKPHTQQQLQQQQMMMQAQLPHPPQVPQQPLPSEQLQSQSQQTAPQQQQQQLVQQQQPLLSQEMLKQQLLKVQQGPSGLTWPASNMRMAQQQQQQQRAKPTRHRGGRAAVMQVPAPVPPVDTGSSGEGNYDYDELLKAGSPATGQADDAGPDDAGVDGVDGLPQDSNAAGADTEPDTGSTNDGGSTNQSQQFQLDPEDPYGLTIDLGRNSKINDPFAPPAPPPPPPPPVPKPPPPEPKQGQLTIDIQPDAFIQAVPPSFIGVSREWTPFVWYDQNLEAFEQVFAQLGPSPILRIGGATQEGLTKLPDARFLKALVKLHCSLGVRYIIGLPLFQNAPQLPLAFKALFDATFKNYPFAIVNYELGNEPNYWPTKEGGFTSVNGATTCAPVQLNNPAYQLVGSMDTPTDRENEGYALYRDAQEPYLPYKPQSYCFTPQTTVFAAGMENYNIYFQRAANALTGCGGLTQDFQAAWGWPYWGPPGFNRKILSGPSWADFNANIELFKVFLQNSNQCYLNEATFHYYGDNRNTTFEALFNKLTAVNPKTNKALITIVKDFIQAARNSNVTLRVSESGSVPDGGQSDFSNTIGAAIWTLVTAMEFAQAGASGINFHWGDGGSPPGIGRAPAYVGVQTGFRNDTVQTPYPVVRVPFYGYVMFSRAFGNNGPGMFLNYSSDAVVSACREFFYTYIVLVPHAGMISVVVANANPNVTCDVTATLPGVTTTSASLQLLSGPPGKMTAFDGVFLAGQTYQGQDDGTMKGRFSPVLIPPKMNTIRTTGWTFNVPPATAALLQIPLIGGANPGVGVDTETPNLVDGGTQEAVDPTTAVWTPPVAVPFPPIPGFEVPEEPGDILLPGSSPAESEPSGDSIDNTDSEAPPADVPAPGAGDSDDGGGRSDLFELDGQALKAKAGVQPGPVPSASPGASPQFAEVKPPVPPSPSQGEYMLKGVTADGRPVYTWRAATAGRTYKQAAGPQQQQQQQQQQRMNMPLRTGGMQAAVRNPAKGSQQGSTAGGVQRGSNNINNHARLAKSSKVSSLGAAQHSQLSALGSFSSHNSLRAAPAGSVVSNAGSATAGSATVPSTFRRGLLGWFDGLKRLKSAAGSLQSATLVGGSGKGVPLPANAGWDSMGSTGNAELVQYSNPVLGMPSDPNTGALSTAEQGFGAAGREAGSIVGTGVSGMGSSAAGVAVGNFGSAGVGGLASGAGAGLAAGTGAGGTVVAPRGGAGFVGSGSAGVQSGGSVSAGVGVSIDANAGASASKPVPQYQNPNLNFIPPRSTGVGPKTRPVPQTAAAEFTPNGPSGVGLVWPQVGNQSVLNVGIPGMGGYQLLPPGYDEEAVRQAAAVCPGIERIYEIQARAGVPNS